MEPEVVMNLWVFTQSIRPQALFPDYKWEAQISPRSNDKMSVIYQLGIRPYMMTGSDDEKTRLLKELAISDFHFARRFSLPDRYYIEMTEADGYITASSGDDTPKWQLVRRSIALVRPDISGMHQMEYFSGVGDPVARESGMQALDLVENSLPTRRIGIEGIETARPGVNRRNLLSVITNVNTDELGNQVARVDDPRRNDAPSTVANLWVFRDEKADSIYSLSGRGYMVHGSDAEKTRILKSLAPNDFRMVELLPVSDEHAANVSANTPNGILTIPSATEYSKDLFNGVFQAIEREIPLTIGIDGNMKNRVTISASQFMSITTQITEHAHNEADFTSVRLTDAPKHNPIIADAADTHQLGLAETHRIDANHPASRMNRLRKLFGLKD